MGTEVHPGDEAGPAIGTAQIPKDPEEQPTLRHALAQRRAERQLSTMIIGAFVWQ